MDLVIINSKKEAITTSRILAIKFNKRHDNVLSKIEQLKTEDKETFNALKIKGVKFLSLSHSHAGAWERGKLF